MVSTKNNDKLSAKNTISAWLVSTKNADERLADKEHDERLVDKQFYSEIEKTPEMFWVYTLLSYTLLEHLSNNPFIYGNCFTR